MTDRTGRDRERPGEEAREGRRAEPPALPHPLLALQAAAGNAATTQLLRQMATPEAPYHTIDPGELVSVDEGPPVTPALGSGERTPAEPIRIPSDLSPEYKRKLMWARTTLARVDPLNEWDEAVVRKLLPGTPILALLKRRDTLYYEVRDLDATIESQILRRGTPDPTGAPRSVGNVAEVEELDRKRHELDTTQAAINDALDVLGIKDEKEFYRLVEERFPQIFLDRAKRIAFTVLDENEQVVRTEARRLGVSLDWFDLEDDSLDPDIMVNGMREAAKQVRDHADDRPDYPTEIDDADVMTEKELDDEGYDWKEYPTDKPPRVSRSYWAAVDGHNMEVAATKNRWALVYPLFLKMYPDQVAQMADMTDEQIRDLAGTKFAEVLENIEETRENIRDGDLKTWHLHDIFAMTMQDLGIEAESPLYTSVQQRVRDEEADESILKIALAAIAITGAIIAALPTGGASLAIAGTAVSVTAGVASLSISVREYMAEKSAENVALDPRIADLSAKSPDLGPVIWDIVGLGFDAADVVRIVKLLSGPVRTVRATGDLAQFARAVDDLVPELGQDGAARVVRTVTRESEVQRMVVQVVDAMGSRFRAQDLADVEAELAKIGQEGLSRGFQELVDAGRVRPLTEDALVDIFGVVQAEVLITQRRVLSWNAFYSRRADAVFVREGEINALSGSVIHELTHRMQQQLRPSMTRYMQEFESFAAQRSYLQRLIADGVDPDVAFPRHKWLANASDADIHRHVVTAYNVTPPAGFDYANAVLEAIAGLGRVE